MQKKVAYFLELTSGVYSQNCRRDLAFIRGWRLFKPGMHSQNAS